MNDIQPKNPLHGITLENTELRGQVLSFAIQQQLKGPGSN
jgi:uncharacterized protein (DUF2132 family)